MPAATSTGVNDPPTFIVAIASEVGREAARAQRHSGDPTRSAHPRPRSQNHQDYLFRGGITKLQEQPPIEQRRIATQINAYLDANPKTRLAPRLPARARSLPYHFT
jgi:hypothetical protein